MIFGTFLHTKRDSKNNYQIKPFKFARFIEFDLKFTETVRVTLKKCLDKMIVMNFRCKFLN